MTHLRITVPGAREYITLCEADSGTLVKSPAECHCLDCLEIAEELLGIPSDSQDEPKNLFNMLCAVVLLDRQILRGIK